MARRFPETPVVSEPYFSQGKKAKEGHFLPLVKLLPPHGPPLASGHTGPDPVCYRKSLQQLTRWAEPTAV